MQTMNKNSSINIFLQMHPVQRIALALLFAFIIYFVIPKDISNLIKWMLLWDVFSLSFLILCWIVLAKRPVPEIRKMAKQDDGSALFVFVLILITSFVSMLTVLLLVRSQDNNSSILYLPVSIAGILFSWIMVHSIYTFHYAHMYYDDDKKNPGKDAYGLEFPEDDPRPNYIDFAYFSFTIGCTFQVSDVEISSPKIRRVVLLHGLLSFALNTFVIALTINLIAGFKIVP
jgi:uncharacterized membrane protein